MTLVACKRRVLGGCGDVADSQGSAAAPAMVDFLASSLNMYVTLPWVLAHHMPCPYDSNTNAR